ncbi:C40 family peptidase [Dactylosporangium sp. AC04546]|uniref:C40 family peptidase n=1 Tax=Dactylosporangium sp. AC04546 TaxID=2862460 RepID=UPI001EE0FAF0|nr:C40 family peptidase [Dactylosporangium sp. AC04546]WVK79306.1 C40 family peptidase [Dactylosporangium sp. AC04546]
MGRRALLTAATLCLTLLVTLLASSGTVRAEPTLAEVERQIDEAWNELEPIIEQYNLVHGRLKQSSDLHHMGPYVGGGWMVHAPTTGDRVRMAKLDGRPIAGYRRPA